MKNLCWSFLYEIKEITKKKFIPCLRIFAKWDAVPYAVLHLRFMCWTWKNMFFKCKSLVIIVHVTVSTKTNTSQFPRSHHCTPEQNIFIRDNKSTDIKLVTIQEMKYVYFNHIWLKTIILLYFFVEIIYEWELFSMKWIFTIFTKLMHKAQYLLLK